MRGDDSDPPPKGGFLLTPIAALSTVPLSRPVGGRYRRYLSLREGSEKTPRSGADEAENGPMELRKNYRKLTTALSRFWHREAGPMNWKNPVRVVGKNPLFPRLG